MFVNTCPKCGGPLVVTSFTYTGSLPLEEGGFHTGGITHHDTSDEVVACVSCSREIHGLPEGRGWHLEGTVSFDQQYEAACVILKVFLIEHGGEIVSTEYVRTHRMHNSRTLPHSTILELARNTVIKVYAEKIGATSWETIDFITEEGIQKVREIQRQALAELIELDAKET